MHAPWTPLVCTIDTPLVYARSQDGAELFKSVTPDEALEKTTAEQAAADPEMMPYFFLQVSMHACVRALRVAPRLNPACAQSGAETDLWPGPDPATDAS